MNAANPRAVIGGNNPPDPIDVALEPYGPILEEVANWLDGATVENDGQLKATDDLLKELKAARKAVDAARDECTKPLHEIWKAEVARWKPTQDDLDRQVKCLVAAQAPYKAKLAAKKEAARREAERAAAEKAEEARRAHQAANAASIEEQRRADELLAQAELAQRDAARAAKDTVKGMRTVQVYAINSHRDALHWIAKNDRDAITAFVEEYVRRNFKQRPIDGVTVETKKEAF
ncbi:hypothetical protein [Sphingomonas baiyangensis]|uniref:Uncharacterized protein n=1 Tax=Sphingomonas baiyangensis TaxID=2572576 RepID=A0A4V5PTI8_9SPHN|nr:hypothetical protein [Sphingomonas baiyangensis]TKD50188.1 hypothetical protein FBR43_05040 [Sphingomonas baiyangensis]